MKIDIDDLELIASELQLAPDTKKQLIQKATDIANAVREEQQAEAQERAKEGQPYLMLIRTGEGHVEDCPLFALKAPAKMNHVEAVEAFKEAIKDHNSKVMSKKGGRKKMIETVGDAFQYLPAKFLKPLGLKIGHKEPLITVFLPNALDLAEKTQEKPDTDG